MTAHYERMATLPAVALRREILKLVHDGHPVVVHLQIVSDGEVKIH